MSDLFQNMSDIFFPAPGRVLHTLVAATGNALLRDDTKHLYTLTTIMPRFTTYLRHTYNIIMRPRQYLPTYLCISRLK